MSDQSPETVAFAKIATPLALLGLIAHTAYLFVAEPSGDLHLFVQFVLLIATTSGIIMASGLSFPQIGESTSTVLVTCSFIAAHLALIIDPANLPLKCVAVALGAIGVFIPYLDTKYAILEPLRFPFVATYRALGIKYVVPYLGMIVAFAIGVRMFMAPFDYGSVNTDPFGRFAERWLFVLAGPTLCSLAIIVCAHFVASGRVFGEEDFEFPFSEWIMDLILSRAGLVAFGLVPIGFASAPYFVGEVSRGATFFAGLVAMFAICVYFIPESFAARQQWVRQLEELTHRANSLFVDFITLRDACDLSRLDENCRADITRLKDPLSDFNKESSLPLKQLELQKLEAYIELLRALGSGQEEVVVQSKSSTTPEPVSDLDAEIAAADTEGPHE